MSRARKRARKGDSGDRPGPVKVGEDGEAQWVINSITHHRFNPKVPMLTMTFQQGWFEFKVVWEGYGVGEASWLNTDAFDDEEAIAEYAKSLRTATVAGQDDDEGWLYTVEKVLDHKYDRETRSYKFLSKYKYHDEPVWEREVSFLDKLPLFRYRADQE